MTIRRYRVTLVLKPVQDAELELKLGALPSEANDRYYMARQIARDLQEGEYLQPAAAKMFAATLSSDKMVSAGAKAVLNACEEIANEEGAKSDHAGWFIGVISYVNTAHAAKRKAEAKPKLPSLLEEQRGTDW